jgi:hypothetical protein
MWNEALADPSCLKTCNSLLYLIRRFLDDLSCPVFSERRTAISALATDKRDTHFLPRLSTEERLNRRSRYRGESRKRKSQRRSRESAGKPPMSRLIRRSRFTGKTQCARSAPDEKTCNVVKIWTGELRMFHVKPKSPGRFAPGDIGCAVSDGPASIRDHSRVKRRIGFLPCRRFIEASNGISCWISVCDLI